MKNHVTHSSYIIVESEYYTAVQMERCMSRLLPTYTLACRIEDVRGIRESQDLEKVSLILAGVTLPDGNSVDAFSSMHIHTPLLFFSSYNRSCYDLSGLNVAGFLLKPVLESEITGALAPFISISNNNQTL